MQAPCTTSATPRMLRDMSARHSPRLVLLCIAAATLLTVIGCGASTKATPSQITSPDGTGSAATQPPITPTVAEADYSAPNLPPAFSVTRISDWAEAERVLGYPIVRSVTFPLTWPNLFVQPAVDGDDSIPRKAVALHTIEGVGVRFTVAPVITWNEGALQKGEPLEIGGRKGWLRHRGPDADYSFPCGSSVQFGEVWCQVEIDATRPSLLTEFVQDLK